MNGELEYCRYSFNGRKRDGTLITIEVFGRIILYQGLPAIIGSLVDITDIRRSQQQLEHLVEQKTTELRYKQESLRTLINAIPDPIFFKDNEKRWLEANLMALQLFGLQNKTWQGMSDDELQSIISQNMLMSLHNGYLIKINPQYLQIYGKQKKLFVLIMDNYFFSM